jgi:hypothetical protein
MIPPEGTKLFLWASPKRCIWNYRSKPIFVVPEWTSRYWHENGALHVRLWGWWDSEAIPELYADITIEDYGAPSCNVVAIELGDLMVRRSYERWVNEDLRNRRAA